MVPSTDSIRFARTRRMSLPVVLWAFGFATSLLLVGLWGRTVVVDTETVQETAETVVDAELVTERVNDWLAAGLESAVATDSQTAQAVAEAVASQPQFEVAIDTIVADVVAGLFADAGEDPVVNIEQALAPLVPVLTRELAAQDVPVETQRIEEALDAAAVIELDTGDARTVAAVVQDARAVLTTVVLLAALALAVLGSVALVLAERRYAMVRTLAVRVFLASITYALLFRVASWALDPNRGRSPILGGGSVVLGSNGHVFLIAAAIATLVASFGGFVAWRRTIARRSAETVASRLDDDTRELLPL
ncbi:MAG: hypothetical protein ACR2N2_02705 [Acidimicrobiia bacterium]